MKTNLEKVFDEIANTINPQRKPGIYSGVMEKIKPELKSKLVNSLAEEMPKI